MHLAEYIHSAEATESIKNYLSTELDMIIETTHVNNKKLRFANISSHNNVVSQ